jgi:hypothetical protein
MSRNSLVTEFTALFALDPGPLPEAVSEQPPPGGLAAVSRLR